MRKMYCTHTSLQKCVLSIPLALKEMPVRSLILSDPVFVGRWGNRCVCVVFLCVSDKNFKKNDHCLQKVFKTI